MITGRGLYDPATRTLEAWACDMFHCGRFWPSEATFCGRCGVRMSAMDRVVSCGYAGNRLIEVMTPSGMRAVDPASDRMMKPPPPAPPPPPPVDFMVRGGGTANVNLAMPTNGASVFLPSPDSWPQVDRDWGALIMLWILMLCLAAWVAYLIVWLKP